jgi:tetratricopeptide (TPR) repeat protein
MHDLRSLAKAPGFTAVAVLLFVTTTATVLAATDPAQLAAARALYEARKISDAQQAFEKIAAADPQCGEAHYFLAHLALDRDDAKAAVAGARAAYEAALKLNPNSASAADALKKLR